MKSLKMKIQSLRRKRKLIFKKAKSRKFGRRVDLSHKADRLLITFQNQKLNLLGKIVEGKVQREKFI